jgi:hypothetical protein
LCPREQNDQWDDAGVIALPSGPYPTLAALVVAAAIGMVIAVLLGLASFVGATVVASVAVLLVLLAPRSRAERD